MWGGGAGRRDFHGLADGMEIKVNDLHKSFGPIKVLDGVTLTIPSGGITTIIGGSGTGKSVFLKHLIGLMVPDRGSIRIDDREIVGLKEHELLPIRRRFGMLFQGGALLASLSCGENAMLGVLELGLADREEAHRRACEKLRMVGLDGAFDKMPAEMSGGMIKRAAIARALMMEPECVLYDEPTAGLDPPRARQIEEVIMEVNQASGATAVVVTHDMDSVRKLADHVWMLHEGRVIFSGNYKELAASPDPHVKEFITR